MTTEQDTEFGRELIASLTEAVAIVRGEAEPARVHLAAGVPDVRAIRGKLGLSQAAFAARFGFSTAAVREWEYGRRRPEQAARTLLLVIARNPQVVVDALEENAAA